MKNLLKLTGKFITLTLSLVWVFYIFYSYISGNVVFTPKINQYFFLTAYIFFLRAFGERIFEMLSVKAERYPSIPKIILDLAIGIGIFNILIYLISLIISNVSLSILISFILMILLSFSNVYKTFLRMLIIETKINLMGLKKREIFMFATLVLLFLSAIILAHTPSVDSTILQGELSLSKQWLLSDIIFLDRPVAPMSLSFYLPFLYAFPDQTIDISIFNAILVLCITIMVYFVVFNNGDSSRIKSLFSSLIFLSAPMILYLGSVPGSRIISLLYFVCSIYIIQRLRTNWDSKAQYITGFFIVFITNSMWLGIIYSFLLLIYLLLVKLKNSKVIIFFMGSIALYFSIFIRFKFLVPDSHIAVFRGIDFSSIFDLFMFPIEISLFNKFTANYLPIGPIILILLPFMIFFYMDYLKRINVIIIILLFILISVFVRLNFKDFLPVYLYLTLISAEVLYKMYKKSRFFSFFIPVFMVVISIINMLNFLQFFIIEHKPVNVIFGIEGFEEYLNSRLDDYGKYNEIQKDLREDDLLIVSNDFNHFYINVPFVSLDLHNRKALPLLDHLSEEYRIYLLLRAESDIIGEVELMNHIDDIKLYKY